MNEVRVFGPPGTGKTTYLSRQVRRAAEARGSESILVASFTRAAATEIAGRRLPVHRAQLGTLHALCFRALDRPDVAEGHLDEWNQHSPHLALKAGGRVDMDHAAHDQPTSGAGEGDRLLAQVETLRARMRPVESWPTSAQAFYTRWCGWKNEAGYRDFTDLIELALRHAPVAPGRPEIGFFDEVQDFTPLDLALVRRWSESMETVLLAGDDDQCIYRFRGATPDAFLDPPVPDEQKRVLSQSWRIPGAVHDMAQSWVQQLSRRESKDYRPRDERGSATLREGRGWQWRSPERMVDEVMEAEEAGRSVMILATCSYMLEPALALLRRNGVPFHNPYRRKRGDWNPLASRADAVTQVDRILALLRPDNELWGEDARIWTALDAHWWMQPLKAKGLLTRGAKTKVHQRSKDEDDVASLELDWLLDNVFESGDDLARALAGDLEWWEANLLAKAAKTAAFPLQVARTRGVQELMRPARVVVGTIHSVKGGEADVVYLFPDVSNAGMREWLQRGDPRDSVVRQFYVGMTRARRDLVVLPPTTGAHVPLNRYVPKG